MKVLSLTLLLNNYLLAFTSYALECPPLQGNGSISQQELISLLTHPCRYDATTRPATVHETPLIVKAKMFIYHIQMAHSTSVEFKVQMLIQLRWLDQRLAYKDVSDLLELVGQNYLVQKLWSPNVFVSNDRISVTGFKLKDQVVSIMPHGEVLLSNRIRTQLECQIEEGNFPFDHQTCRLIMDNWRYNQSEMLLQWEKEKSLQMPVTTATLPEFNLISTTTTNNYLGSIDDFLTTSGECDRWSENSVDSLCDVQKSSLVVVFHFARKFGFYFWNYYVPSVCLVVTSWWTFWIDPQVIPARVWLATYTMLGFFGLGAMSDAMPVLTQLKMNDIWFIGCSFFIFLSLAEFAFVNLVHRQQTKNIPLKKISSKYILKSSLRTETLPWKNKSSSCPSSPEFQRQRKSVHAKKRKQQQKSVAFNMAISELSADTKTKRLLMRRRQAFTGSHMTNVEMANWIDYRSRAVFPIAFIVFNLLFWSLMFT